MKTMKILIAAALFAVNVPAQAISVSTRQILDGVGAAASTWVAVRTFIEGRMFSDWLRNDPNDPVIQTTKTLMYTASAISGAIAADYTYRFCKSLKQKNDALQKAENKQ